MAKKAVESVETGDTEVTEEMPAGAQRFSCCVPALGGTPVETVADSKEEAEAWFRSQVNGLDPQAKVSVTPL